MPLEVRPDALRLDTGTHKMVLPHDQISDME